MASGYRYGQDGTEEPLEGGATENLDSLLNHKRHRDSWPLEEENSTRARDEA